MKPLNHYTDRFFNELSLAAVSGEQAESDKTCFKKQLEKFLASGSKEDAFTVYFCFAEIFKVFGNGYDNTKKLLETLSDHEYHSGELLSKHRDHYSHSVYVFALGLAIYAGDGNFGSAFNRFYGCETSQCAALKFLYLWGMCSLFHDIGYPFQLAHEQIKSYSEELWGKKNPQSTFVSYGNLETFTAIDVEAQSRLQTLLGVSVPFPSIDVLLAYGLKLREGYDEAAVIKKLRERIAYQPNFMDHGYFSAVILAKQLLSRPDFPFGIEMLDVLTAILLHNNFNKYDAPDRHPIALDEHPLSYLLIICDELQCWDRLAYGKVSKRDPIAWDICLSIGDNRIAAEYVFESSEICDGDGETRPNKSYFEISSGEFLRKIKSYVNTDLNLTAAVRVKPKKKKSYLYASDNSFINLCDFAKAVHASYIDNCTKLSIDRVNDSFDELPLEFKVSNIEQAKSYAYKLELINCFYSSKELDYPVVNSFKSDSYGLEGADNLGFLCREEHLRWVKEKISFGWKYGKDYKDNKERNRKKIHKDLVPYEVLTKSERKKDEIMIDNIIPLLKKFGNNIKIYSYRTGRKPDLEIAGTGHRFIKGDTDKLKAQIKKILLKYNENYRVIVRTCYAYGADQLIAECANELGITTKAVIPDSYEIYIKTVRRDCAANGKKMTADEVMKMRLLLAQTVVCKTVKDSENYHLGASKYIIDKCDKLIALWDGEELPLEDENGNGINLGGTYHCIKMARDKGLKDGKDVYIINCER